MPRKSYKIRYSSVSTDTLYQNKIVRLFVTQLIKKGKARLAHRILYTAIDICRNSNNDGVDVLSKAVLNTTPNVEVRPRRKGGSVYQVPIDIPVERGIALAIRWIVQSARARTGRSMASKLASEFQDAAKNTGAAVRKKDDMQRMAEANKAFAHMRR
jgi:small subunit ribosomal protein S7